MVIDTGASIDIIDELAFNTLQKQRPIALQRSKTRIFAYGATNQLPVMGQFRATLECLTGATTTQVHVIKGNFGCLLSYQTASALGLIMLNVNNVKPEHATHEQLMKEYAHLFNGIGTLKNFEVKLHIDDTVPPVAQTPRRIPFHMRQKVDTLESDGIIEKVSDATPWVSPLVVIPKKDGEIRLCIDMRMANQAIQRERHPTPTVDDLIHKLNGATIFTKLDLRSGYHQLSLAEESRHITTFVTHKGLYRYKKLNFGTNSASEIFQHVISEQIRYIPNAINISDDIIIFGITQAEHDKALHEIFERFSLIGLTFNKDKCEFSQSQLTFFGFVFSGDGISPDPAKVSATHNCPPPNSIKAVRSFLGMVTYCAKFIPNFSDLTEPLRELTRKDVPFCWTSRHAKSFNAVKAALTSATVMAYFDQTKETELITDASPFGLSAILTQKVPGSDQQNVVACISRSLSDVERRYCQTEREALAIVWAIERLHIYLYGGHFTLITDCKPVELILNNPQSRPPARIERWNLRLQDYDFNVRYTKGLDNPSDFLSRHLPVNTTTDDRQFQTMADNYVCFLTQHAVPRAMTLPEIQQATMADSTLQILSNLITTESLRLKAVQIAHEGHQGLVKTKQLLQEKVWYPGGSYRLVIIDAYSRFPEVEIVSSTSAKSTILKLERIFATHGIPKVLKSDNGPPFQSHEFSLYLKELGIKHKPSSPLWLQGNGQAENFMKPLVKAVKSAHHENKDWKREMFKFLLNYRATPHSTTGKSPSELLYNRKIQTKLPQVTVENDSSLHQEVKERDERLKKNQKEYADSKRRVKCADIKKSDLVLVRQPKANKMSTKYDPIPYEVTNRRGNRITAIRNGKYITRNISFFKKYHPRHGRSLESTEIMDEENYSSDEDVHEEHEQYDGLRQNDRPRQNNGQRQDDGPRYPARERQRVYRYGNNIYD
ncbi:Transposon Tf2-9 poly [Paramuricea clavata]|uniref:Transposon Tf2-9 poly n=1 Tax=Paramuricea clavata TaxID=317549 RepID=A0A6S7KIP8_PARCT|nr:Transposon Tf2-9 poly [Paramuricea clavata]